MPQSLILYDTTLRDGNQSEGISYSAEDKIRIARRLDAFGMDYIEGGWPGSNPKDMEFFKRAAEMSWEKAKIAAFGSTRRKDVRVKKDANIRLLLDAQTPVVTILANPGIFTSPKDCVQRTKRISRLSMIPSPI